MIVLDEVHKKALDILNNREKIEDCIKAGICPVCGEPLLRAEEPGLFSTYTVTKCSIDDRHYITEY